MTNTPDTMTQAAFARHRGVSRPTVTEYKQRGLLVMTDEGLVNVKASEERLAEHLDPGKGGDRSGKEKPAAAKQGSGDYLAAKAREAQAKAIKAEMDNAERAGVLCEADKASRTAFTLARNTQEALRGIADRLAPSLAAETDAAKVHAMLSDEVRQICNTLADKVQQEFGA